MSKRETNKSAVATAAGAHANGAGASTTDPHGAHRYSVIYPLSNQTLAVLRNRPHSAGDSVHPASISNGAGQDSARQAFNIHSELKVPATASTTK